ncbi:hypothetical protein T01_14290 [Trichinella spiralis]|uniref:Uncharacterized protein n=1 Tax=Trichinella spiralis TaxID=6334 RepID=A0A0V0Z1U0_TRISP|nr:hypothetical protein T01_14290 [Trichinella spiralis]
MIQHIIQIPTPEPSGQIKKGQNNWPAWLHCESYSTIMWMWHRVEFHKI